MIIFKCRFTGDEMCSDAFKPEPVKDAEGNVVEGLMQIKSQKVNKVSGIWKSMLDAVPYL
jgi:Translationally controlled tumour protein